jgi:hypothetical protein
MEFEIIYDACGRPALQVYEEITDDAISAGVTTDAECREWCEVNPDEFPDEWKRHLAVEFHDELLARLNEANWYGGYAWIHDDGSLVLSESCEAAAAWWEDF